jgi:hypothetical protein
LDTLKYMEPILFIKYHQKCGLSLLENTAVFKHGSSGGGIPFAFFLKLPHFQRPLHSGPIQV